MISTTRVLLMKASFKLKWFRKLAFDNNFNAMMPHRNENDSDFQAMIHFAIKMKKGKDKINSNFDVYVVDLKLCSTSN